MIDDSDDDEYEFVYCYLSIEREDNSYKMLQKQIKVAVWNSWEFYILLLGNSKHFCNHIYIFYATSKLTSSDK
jgi:hypothetical protein